LSATFDAADAAIILLQNCGPTGYKVDMAHRRHDAEPAQKRRM
jgi:hypothetical protein